MEQIIFLKAIIIKARKVFEEIPEANSGYVFYIADKENLLKIESTSQEKQYQEIINGSSGNTNLATLKQIHAFNETPNMKDNENKNAQYRAHRMNKLLIQYDGKINQEIMLKIASDHGEIRKQNRES